MGNIHGNKGPRKDGVGGDVWREGGGREGGKEGGREGGTEGEGGREGRREVGRKRRGIKC